MDTEQEKKVITFIFRAIFALETGGGQFDVSATNEKEAWKKLEKIVPQAFHKIKKFETVRAC